MIVGARCRSLDSYWLIVSTSCQGRGARVQHVAIDLEPDHATLGQAAFGARDPSSFQVDACQAVAGKAEERCDRVLDSGRRLQGQMFNPFRKLVTVDTHYYHEGSPGREVDVGWRAGPTIEKIDNRTRRRRRLRTSGFKPGAPRHRLRRPTTFLGQASIREARFLRMMRAAGALPHALKYIKADEVILPILEVLVNLGDGEPPSQHAEPPPAILEDEREENAEDEVGDGELARKVPRTNETEGTRAPGQCSLCCKRLRKKNYLDVAVWTAALPQGDTSSQHSSSFSHCVNFPQLNLRASSVSFPWAGVARLSDPPITALGITGEETPDDLSLPLRTKWEWSPVQRIRAPDICPFVRNLVAFRHLVPKRQKSQRKSPHSTSGGKRLQAGCLQNPLP
ncbi:hypothetical protein AK812_SmicGene20842 [Symbiodinium microadriaticum]|uniref:Uncharacterized protein n=1 Tax=Symbiodinium microadriaticum TaxID=2951 RepID=A0A1Q9DNY7_SYMMI|nr:hypothetical protein AK812_SmicGene20842 [Symbiodinium microadriaticum]